MAGAPGRVVEDMQVVSCLPGPHGGCWTDGHEEHPVSAPRELRVSQQEAHWEPRGGGCQTQPEEGREQGRFLEGGIPEEAGL